LASSLATFVFETVNFLLLAVALGWLFLRPMRKLLDDERSAHNEAERKAKEAAAQAEHTRAELTERLAALHEEADRIRATARGQAEQDAAHILERARSQLEDEQRRAEREAQGQREAHTNELARDVGLVAGRIVVEVFARAGEQGDLALARAARDQLSAMAAHGATHFLVESARPLGDDARGALRSALGGAFDGAQLRVVPELVAGVRVTSEAGLVDATALGLATAAQRAIAPRGGLHGHE
jgi:F0F1-type ATP synthase membrane subunit b/b'